MWIFFQDFSIRLTKFIGVCFIFYNILEPQVTLAERE